MNNINSYLDDLLKIKDSESSYSTDIEFFAKGGEVKNRPTGGFPPIYVCENISSDEDLSLFKDEPSRERKYATHKNTVSIKDIMEKRKVTPFI